MTDKDLILAIDNGTQSLKALLFDAQGMLRAHVRVPFKPYFSKHPGWAEQDPEVFWEALCKACNALWEQNGVDKGCIAGVALTTQRGTVINLDKNGRPLRPAILWLDQRKTDGLPWLKGMWGILFRILGLKSTVAYLQAEAEVNWIRTHEPEIWEQTHKYLLLSGYLTHRLIGAFRDSVGCQVGYIPFDYKRLKWSAGWDWKWRAVPMDMGLLPELVPPGSLMGSITRAAAEQTGIPEGVPLIASAADKACEVIGSGCLDPSVGCLSYGTTATINVTHEKYLEPIRLLPAYPSAIPDTHTLEVQIYRGFWMVNWFKEEFGFPECRQAELDGVAAETLFDQLVADIPPGSLGLMLQPYWTPGLKMPGPEAKGAIIGFGDVHTRAHLFRSILEGLAYALRDGKERIEKRTRVPIERLRVSGGGSQSRVAMQVTADVFGIPAEKPAIYETSGLGAAMDGAVGLGLHSDFPKAVAAMTHVGETFEPHMETHMLYGRLYGEVYKKMYDGLRPLYERIREITGYPR
ncbi:MAG: FGGY-family carbohydrate kinase [Deltaproteobacteria bacterium]|nr:FGGY-family carbohydrate kinase [Deltaproteobacteria bacterium]